MSCKNIYEKQTQNKQSGKAQLHYTSNQFLLIISVLVNFVFIVLHLFNDNLVTKEEIVTEVKESNWCFWRW